MIKYEVISQIGHGSCSRVFLARRLIIDSGDASCLTAPTDIDVSRANRDSVSSTDENIVVLKERDKSNDALAEAQLLKSLRPHPCIVKFEDAFLVHDIDKVCIIMERAKRDLKQVLETHVKKHFLVSASVSYRWICQIALGVAHLHSRGIVHRDIKPANLLVLPDGRLVLGDLGTAKRNVFAEEFGSKTMLGTPFYLAPEVLQGREYGNKADVWSLGCVAYELATSGTYRAFEAKSIDELRDRVQRGDVDWRCVSRGAKEFTDDIVRPALRSDSQMRSSIDDILSLPQIIRAIGGFVADLRQGKFQLPRSRAECLLIQLADLGLRNTVVAGMQLGARRKRLGSPEFLDEWEDDGDEEDDDEDDDGDDEVVDVHKSVGTPAIMT